jgi:hypothetical protein
MKTKITTAILLLISVGFALAGEGSQFQPVPANKQANVAAHICDEHSTAKSRPRTPGAPTGLKAAPLAPCVEHAKTPAYTASDWTRHRSH